MPTGLDVLNNSLGMLQLGVHSLLHLMAGIPTLLVVVVKCGSGFIRVSDHHSGK